MMIRIIWHWTAGSHTANTTDKRHYHFIIEGDGTVVAGNHLPEVNAVLHNPNSSSTYAAHTRGLNTGSIGIAVAAMRGAQERPFNAGPSPITEAQVEALVKLTARLCAQYDIQVERDTVLSHAEVQPTLKVAQRNKWDITWLPGMKGVGDAVAVGDELRKAVREEMQVAKHPLSVFIKAIATLFTKARK